MKTIGSEGSRQCPHQRSEPADPAGFTCGGETGESDVCVCEAARFDERQAVTRRPGDQVEWLRVLQHSENDRGVGERLRGGQCSIDEDVAVI